MLNMEKIFEGGEWTIHRGDNIPERSKTIVLQSKSSGVHVPILISKKERDEVIEALNSLNLIE